MFSRDALISIEATVWILNINHFPTNKISGQEKQQKIFRAKDSTSPKNGYRANRSMTKWSIQNVYFVSLTFLCTRMILG